MKLFSGNQSIIPFYLAMDKYCQPYKPILCLGLRGSMFLVCVESHSKVPRINKVTF